MEVTTMETRLGLVLMMIGGLFIAAERGRAGDAPKPDLQPLLAELRHLVEKYYPDGKVTLKDRTIHFEFNIRKFMIHEPLKTGEWQDAHEESGPQKGGIYGDIELRSGKYNGAAGLPASVDKRYFTLRVIAPYSQKLNRHLYIHMKYPRDVSKEFLKDFERLVREFDKHVPPTLPRGQGR
jgi:hypothetical protein